MRKNDTKTLKHDNIQLDRPITATKLPIVKPPISERNQDKVSGLKVHTVHTLPGEMTKEVVVKFLQHHTKLNMETLNTTLR